MEKSKLNLRLLSDGKAILLDDYIYDVNGYPIKVFKGFITDGASIPKVLQCIYNPYGKWIKGAVIHDYLYSKYNTTGINRKLADKIFKMIMLETGVNKNTANKFYKAVRLFGEMSWQDKIYNEGYKDQAIIDRTKEAKEYYMHWNKILKL